MKIPPNTSTVAATKYIANITHPIGVSHVGCFIFSFSFEFAILRVA